MRQHSSTLKRVVVAQLGSDAGAGDDSKMELEWQGDTETLKVQLQKHREGAVSRCYHHAVDMSISLKATINIVRTDVSLEQWCGAPQTS